MTDNVPEGVDPQAWALMSVAEKLALQPGALEYLLSQLTNEQILGMLDDWEGFYARPSQREPEGDWAEWFLCTGRGFGKTRTSAEWCYKRVLQGSRSGFLLGRTAEQVRDLQVTGPDGLLAIAKAHGTPWEYKSSEAVVITHTGSRWKMHTSEKPDSVRGPTYDSGWIEEFATLKSLVGADGLSAFDNARFTLRAVGELQPRLVMATTPKRVKAVKTMLLEAQDPSKKIVVTRGALMENISNLASTFVEGIVSRHGGTALGDQELKGELAKDVEGAIFTSAVFGATRITDERDLPELLRPILAIDPSVGDGSGDKCGMCVMAASAGTMPTEIKHGALSVIKNLRHLYVLEDASIAADPDAWANHAVEICEKWGILHVIAEGNQGQRLIRSMLKARNPSLRVELVNARVGKEARAQPVAGLFSQGRAHLVGEFPDLEDVCTTWVPGTGQESPDEMDAMVWGATHLEPSIGKKEQKPYTPPGAFGKSL